MLFWTIQVLWSFKLHPHSQRVDHKNEVFINAFESLWSSLPLADNWVVDVDLRQEIQHRRNVLGRHIIPTGNFGALWRWNMCSQGRFGATKLLKLQCQIVRTLAEHEYVHWKGLFKEQVRISQAKLRKITLPQKKNISIPTAQWHGNYEHTSRGSCSINFSSP